MHPRFSAQTFPTSHRWREAIVTEVDRSVPHAVRIRMDVPDRSVHLPGQYYVVRLTAENGYTAARSYSLASDPGDEQVELFVERLPDGEVSGFLAAELEPGDHLEVRGPIGGWFLWPGEEPALLVAGGSGVVPIAAMVRHAQRLDRLDLLTVIVAARTRADLPYADELEAAGAVLAFSREDTSARPAGRLTADDLAPLIQGQPDSYLCGSSAFTEAAGELLVGLGVPTETIRVERFGPSSGG